MALKLPRQWRSLSVTRSILARSVFLLGWLAATRAMAPWSLPALKSAVSRAATLDGRVPLLSARARASLAAQLRNETSPRRAAAVLVPLCVVEGEAAVLFTLRSGAVSTHKHQVSFPGGHLEPGESAVAAARREAVEELSAALGAVRVLGACETVPAVTGTLVTPVLGVLERPLDVVADLEPAPGEVERAFALSVAHLADARHRGVQDLGARGRVPVFHGGPADVWGLTAFVLDGVLRRVVRPSLEVPPRDGRSTRDG